MCCGYFMLLWQKYIAKLTNDQKYRQQNEDVHLEILGGPTYAL
jgi:hypothetical protein